MTTHSVADLCERYACGEHTVLGWINRGELKAINAARRSGTRPRYRITPEALAEFEASRTVSPEPPPAKRRKKTSDAAHKYYAE